MQRFYDKYLASKKRNLNEVICSVKKESTKRSKLDPLEDTFDELLDHVPVMPITVNKESKLIDKAKQKIERKDEVDREVKRMLKPIQEILSQK
jgi:hypothetical protein